MGNLRSSCDILTVENTKGLLQGLDFFLAACNTILVALTCIHTGWLELLIIRQGSVQLLLCAVEICLGFLERLLMVLLLSGLVLDVLGLLSLVHRRITHEFVVLLLCLSFGSAGLGLEACK